MNGPFLAAFAVAAGLAAPVPGAAPRLAFPLACQIGRTCEIQHYVDRDPGPGAADYHCGLQTYDTHSGIDIRLPDMAAQRRGVAVLAAAPGRVARLRDGVADIAAGTPGAPSVANQECGNGVILDHGGGWETHYCHMARGSIAVSVGQEVAAGTPLGRVGLSGQTQFAHLHLTVSHAGKVVDPFAPEPTPPGSCKPQAGLWTPQARAQMAYRAGVVLNAGFTQTQVGRAEVENGDVAAFTAASSWLIVYVRAIALLPGDEVELDLKGPDGQSLARARQPPLASWRAEDLRLVGKRRPAAGWPPGVYAADYRVWRRGKVAISRRMEMRL
ncbi:M23 family metallopeptidase [Phenylobacterium sp.]|uniref:M23 family metallopeptidase n=1 Tax=Phenylobacterium sp. TaxID=1871053 RepID=UPI0025EC6CED|nr:M23 family metallopeptidase [Phenylobacterium sp.]